MPTASPPPTPRLPFSPYQVALEALEEALMLTVVPPPSPPHAPKYVPKDPPTPQKKTHFPWAIQCQDTAAHPGQPPGLQYFVDGVLNHGAMYRFAVQQPKKNPLLVSQEGMRISRSHFLSRDEQHAAVVPEAISAPPTPPRVPKPPPRAAPSRPLCPPPPPSSDQVTPTQCNRHRRSSLLPLASAPKRPCPAPTSLPP